MSPDDPEVSSSAFGSSPKARMLIFDGIHRRSPIISLRVWNPVRRAQFTSSSLADPTLMNRSLRIAAGALEPALKLYERSKSGGIDRAEQNIRNVRVPRATRSLDTSLTLLRVSCSTGADQGQDPRSQGRVVRRDVEART